MGWWFRRNEHDEEQLSAYMDGELDARQAEKVERHLASCEACSALLEELRETRALLSALPSHAPPRSFVLGAEYAQAPVRDQVRPSKRFNLALAPALALTVFVALVFVDLTNSTSSSTPDESPSALSVATSRQADAVAPGAASVVVPPAASNAGSGGGSADSSDTTGEAGTGPVAPEAATNQAPTTMSAEVAPAPEPASGGDITAAGQAADNSAPREGFAPQADSDADGDGSGGFSTLRILEILAGAAFLASGFYVFVWPRLSRGGS
jgi:anti-sigma factor RsiW